MRKGFIIVLLGVILIVLLNAEGAWMGSFRQRGSATHELDYSGLGAAHPSLPLKSLVRVTNLQNHKQVIVTIVGRIVPSGNRIIDLSRQAASTLGMTDKGVTAVSIEAVRERSEN
jgi:rare lipoprotein A